MCLFLSAKKYYAKSYKQCLIYIIIKRSWILTTKMTEENAQQYEYQDSKEQYMQFLYVVVKEYYVGSKSEKVDNIMRIVYWKQEWDSDYPAQFVVYGQRPDSKKQGTYIPYRLRFLNKAHLEHFIRTVIVQNASSDHRVVIELRQFSGLNNDSEDEYNIEWENTAENNTDELVAFKIDSTFVEDGEIRVNYAHVLGNVLTVLENSEIV